MRVGLECVVQLLMIDSRTNSPDFHLVSEIESPEDDKCSPVQTSTFERQWTRFHGLSVSIDWQILSTVVATVFFLGSHHHHLQFPKISPSTIVVVCWWTKNSVVVVDSSGVYRC